MLIYVLHTFYFVLLIGVLGACLLFCCWVLYGKSCVSLRLFCC